jgi:hypothetical protein
MLTLYTTPVVYLYVHRYWSKKKRKAAPIGYDQAGLVT